MTLKLSQSVLQTRVFKQGILDLHVKDYMLGQTKKYLSKEKNTIDVGAATGMYTSFFAEHSKWVYSFEAVPPVYNQLVKVKNRFNNITTYNNAVCNFIGESNFYVDDKRLSNSGFQNLVNGQEISVNTVTIDSMSFSNVGFIKVDVEGNELDVLNGAIKTIEDNRPVCMVEVYAKFNKYPVETTFDFFFDLGYNCFYNYKGDGLRQVLDLTEALDATKIPEITDGDFLFVPEGI